MGMAIRADPFDSGGLIQLRPLHRVFLVNKPRTGWCCEDAAHGCTFGGSRLLVSQPRRVCSVKTALAELILVAITGMHYVDCVRRDVLHLRREENLTKT